MINQNAYILATAEKEDLDLNRFREQVERQLQGTNRNC